jgi:hypothetical protein
LAPTSKVGPLKLSFNFLCQAPADSSGDRPPYLLARRVPSMEMRKSLRTISSLERMVLTVRKEHCILYTVQGSDG